MIYAASTYSKTLSNNTHFSVSDQSSSTGKAQRERFAEYYAFSDEGNAGGFSNSKAQRECFAERYGFSATNATVRDEETGFGYFGARYMDHELMTMWLSVDPMSDKYPSISPYAYCAWTRPTGGDEHRWIKYNIVNNPVKLVDPDGMEFDGYKGSNGQYQWFDKHTEQSFVDENGVTWNKVTDDQDAWKEAATIREANIQGLESLGYERSDAERDVRLYDGKDPLFTKESLLLNSQNYTSNWEPAINSDEGNAKQSPVKEYQTPLFYRTGGMK